VWQSFAAADWVDFNDIEKQFQQVRVCWFAVGVDVTSGPVPRHTAGKLALLQAVEARSLGRLAGSVWQSFAAADWVDFDDFAAGTAEGFLMLEHRLYLASVGCL
jgi:hypothetical protein